MSEKSVHTKTVRKGVAKSNTVKLIKTANIAIHFEPILHEGGVRGRLIKYKKTSAKTGAAFITVDNAVENMIVIAPGANE